MAVMLVNWRDGGQQQTAISVGQHVTLAPNYAAVGIKAAVSHNANPAGAGCLGIYDRSRWAGFTPHALPVSHGKAMAQTFKYSSLRQAQEPAMHGRPRRELAWQVPPSRAGAKHIKDRIHNEPQWPEARSTSP